MNKINTHTTAPLQKPLNNGTSYVNNSNNNNKRLYVESSFNHMPTAQRSVSPHSPTTSSSSTSSLKHNDALILNDQNLKLNLITHLLKNNDLVLNCVQFVNLIDLYFEDEQCSNLNEDASRKSHDPLNFLYDFKSNTYNTVNNELKLMSDTSSATTTCFPCIVCSNRFSFEQTFHLHLERRSIFIRFFCSKCQAYKSFYNRCKLLYHVYSHKMFLFEPIYKSIKIENITIERLNLSKERNIDFSSCINFNYNTSELISDQTPLNDSLITSLVTNKSNRIQQADNESIKTFMKRLIQNKFLLFRCSICDALFFDIKELKSHCFKNQQHELEHLNAQNTTQNPVNRRYLFKNLKQKYFLTFNKDNFDFINDIITSNTSFHTNNNNSNCNLNNNDLNNDKANMFVNIINDLSIKKLQFSTRCSILANMNLINLNYQFYQPSNTALNAFNSKPNRALICPECGISFDPKTQFDKFRLHLIYECMFTSKYDCGQIKCLAFNCTFIAESVNDFVSHWSKMHIKNEHQCDLCDKKGVQFIFENSSTETVNNHTDSNATHLKNSQMYKSILNSTDEGNESDSNMTNNTNNLTDVNEPILSPATISDINKHFFEKHRNLQVTLKLVYRCSCKVSTNLNENNSDQECIHTTWKACHKHIISLIAKTLASINCLLCNKLVSNNEYINHLRSNHNLERMCVCPICGVLKDESSLQNHILRMHYQLNLNDHPMSSFFNLVTTLNKSLSPVQLLHLNSGNIQNLIQMSNNLIPHNFSVYQCLNCRLFFASNCKFSHNCWTYVEVNKETGAKQQATNNNYFSPIYLKFNVSKTLKSMKENAQIANIKPNNESQKRKLNELETNESENS